MTNPAVLAVLLVYLSILLGLGLWARRESRNIAGYYVANKKLPSWVIAFSSNATGESAWLLLGLTGMGYLVGVHAFWVVLGEVLGVTLAWVLVALPFKEYTDRYDAITVPDYLERRFRDDQHLFRLISAVVIVTMAAAYTAAQMTASGKAFDSFLGTGYQWGVLIGTAVILFYTMVGGFKAVAYSDVIQGVLMFLGLLAMPVVGIWAAGGWTSMLSRLQLQNAQLLDPMGSGGNTLVGWISALSFVGVGIAFLGAPQLLTRFISARGRKEIINGGLIAVVCIIVFDAGAVLAGMAGRALFAGLDDPETILPLMSAELFPALFTGIFLVIVLAAMMSTADSILILASSAVVRDTLQKTAGVELSDAQLSRLARWTTGLIGLVSLALALGESRVIFTFVLFAWSGLASAFTPAILCSLFWKGTTRAGAVAGMCGGFLVTVTWVLYFKESFYDLYEMIPGCLVGLALTIAISLMSQPPEGAEEEYESVWETVGRLF